MIRFLFVVLLGLIGAQVYFRVARAEVVVEPESSGGPAEADDAWLTRPVAPLAATEMSEGLFAKGEWRGKPAMCDLNGDGHVDIVASVRRWDAATKGEGIYAFLGDGTGRWTAKTEGMRRDMGYGGSAIADVNGDGTLDIAFSGHERFPHVFLNALDLEGGAWTVAVKDGIETKAIAADVALGDLDGDGFLDLALVGQFPKRGGVSLFRGDGTGAFAPWTDLVSRSIYGAQITIEDIDASGLPELIAVTATGPKVWRYRDGDVFDDLSAGLPTPKIGGSDMGLLVTDLDGEPGLEIVVAGLPYRDHAALRMFRRDGDEWRQWGHQGADHDAFYDVALCRLAKGARPSLVLAGKRGVSIVDVSKRGEIAVRGLIENTQGAFNVAAGDVDGDGCDEILYLGFQGVRVFRLAARPGEK